MYKRHKDILKVEHHDTTVAANSTENEDAETNSVYVLENEDFNEMFDDKHCLEAAKFILKTRDGRRLTQRATDDILHDTRAIVQYSIENLEQEVTEKLKELSMSDGEIACIKELFYSSKYRNPFEGLETEYKQEKFFPGIF